MKTQKVVKLTAVDINSVPVTSNNCQTRMDFTNKDKEISVTEWANGKGVVIHTLRGEYQIAKHPTINAFIGVCSGYKVRVVLKKMVGTLTYQS